jgi:hypothetical protein
MIPSKELSSVFAGAFNFKHSNYAETVKLAEKLTVHADGVTPRELIEERRPSEPQNVKEYRCKIYKPITRTPVNKVITSLGKIRRSPDWQVNYKQVELPAQVAEAESLQAYCELNYPNYTSITNWAFSELLKRYLLDANSIVSVIPQSIPSANNEYMKPVAKVFPSTHVYRYVPGEYAVLLSSETVAYSSPQGRNTYMDGQVFYEMDRSKITRWEQASKTSNFVEAWTYAHGFGTVPAFKVPGIFMKEANNDIINESRIAAMVPSLDEAVREYSDLQAEIVQHIFSEKYMYANAECPICKGTGFSDRDPGKKCPHCNGVGSIVVSQYGVHLITQSKAGENPVPMPPIGYIQKQTEIAILQDTRVRQHKYDALASINMEFLSETPLNQSGIAKEVDRDELNNFVSGVAEDIVAVLDKVYRFINDYRYSLIVPDAAKRMSMLPSIPVPERFDLLSASQIMTELKSAKEAGVNPEVVRSLEIDLTKKKFNADPEKAEFLELIYRLDPLPGNTEDEKASKLSNGGITETAYIISSNIMPFVQMAVHEHKDFYRKKLPDQIKVMEEYAKKIQEANDASQEVKNSLMQQQMYPTSDPNNPETNPEGTPTDE